MDKGAITSNPIRYNTLTPKHHEKTSKRRNILSVHYDNNIYNIGNSPQYLKL